MRIAARLRSAVQRLRYAAGRTPRNNVEVSEYLRYVTRRQISGAVRLAMPWGELECTNVGVARSQFEEIFIRRQYAFGPANAPTIVDCGGNIGLSAIWFLQNYPGCQLAIYEADPTLTQILKRNLARAGFPKVTVHNRAVWIDDSELTFSATGIDTGKIDRGGNVRVQAIDLATSLPERVDLLKMDIEGAEFDVFERLLTTGAIQRIRRLAVEFHPTRANVARLLNIFHQLEGAGFRVSFDSFHGPYCGLEATASPFEFVGRNRMFVQMFGWKE